MAHRPTKLGFEEGTAFSLETLRENSRAPAQQLVTIQRAAREPER